VFREVANGAKTNRARLRQLLDQLDAGDVLTVTRLDRLARSTRDLLNTLAAIADREGPVQRSRPQAGRLRLSPKCSPKTLAFSGSPRKPVPW
jgi:hypothetical protein